VARVRTFVAVDLNAAVRRQAQLLIHELAARTTAVKWVSAEQLHVTVKFLGDVDDTELYEVCRAVDRAVSKLKPFEVICRGVGAFPHAHRPRTLWLGLEDPAHRMAQLQQQVEAEFASLGFPRDVRPFHAHVTIGRVEVRHRRWGQLTDELDQYAERELGSFPVNQCTVYTSELTPTGPIYTAIGHLQLGHDLP
jgi:2'-5' RNA ligase